MNPIGQSSSWLIGRRQAVRSSPCRCPQAMVRRRMSGSDLCEGVGSGVAPAQPDRAAVVALGSGSGDTLAGASLGPDGRAVLVLHRVPDAADRREGYVGRGETLAVPG